MESTKYGVSRNYTITARTEQQLNALEQVFKHMQSLGSMGRSKMVNIYVDGDGQMQLRFERDGKQLEKSDDIGFGHIDIEKNSFDLG